MLAIFPEISACAASGDIEKLAILARRYFGGEDKQHPRFAVDQLLSGAGVPIQTLQIPELAVLVARDQGGRPEVAVVLQESVQGEARRFLCAHLLGHYLLDVQPAIARGEWETSGFRELTCPSRRFGLQEGLHELDGDARKLEQRADEFAAALLMPMGMLRKAAARLASPAALAEFFAVSPTVAERRLEVVGLTAAKPANFLAAESALHPDDEPAALDDKGHGAEAPTVNISQPPQEANMPRSYAASTYTKTQDRTKASPVISAGSKEAAAAKRPAKNLSSDAAEKPADQAAANPDGQPIAKGLAKLRDLARQIDSSVK